MVVSRADLVASGRRWRIQRASPPTSRKPFTTVARTFGLLSVWIRAEAALASPSSSATCASISLARPDRRSDGSLLIWPARSVSGDVWNTVRQRQIFLNGADAVLAPDGAVLHAERDARERDARLALLEAAGASIGRVCARSAPSPRRASPTGMRWSTAGGPWSSASNPTAGGSSSLAATTRRRGQAARSPNSSARSSRSSPSAIPSKVRLNFREVTRVRGHGAKAWWPKPAGPTPEKNEYMSLESGRVQDACWALNARRKRHARRARPRQRPLDRKRG
jgi:hypothetical protein